MRVLVTGGSGFIGQALVAALRAREEEVVVLTRDPTRTAQRLGPGVRCVDRLDALGDCGLDAVVNLAGENLGAGRWSASRKQALRDSRLHVTEALCAFLGTQSQPPGVLVSASAIGYYGSRGDEILNEDAAPGDDFGAQLCRDWENAALACARLGMRVCIARFGVVFGDGGALAQMLPPFRLGVGGPLGSGQQWMSWIMRDDLVRLLLWLIDDSAASGCYNAVAPNPVPNREFARALAAALHRPAVMRTPATMLRMMFGEMSELMLASQRVVPRRTLNDGFVFRHPQVGPALQDLLDRER